MKSILYQKELKALYYSLIYPYLTYGIEVWRNAYKGQISRVHNIQKKVIRCVTQAHYLEHTEPLFKKFHLFKIEDIYELYYKRAMAVGVSELFVRNPEVHQYNTRQRSNPRINKWCKAVSKRAFAYMYTHLWSKVARDLQKYCSYKNIC